MFNFKIWALSLVLLCGFIQTAHCQETVTTLSTTKKDITVMFNGQAFPWELQEDRISFPFMHKTHQIGFVTDIDTLAFELKPADTVKVRFILNQKDTIHVAAVGQQNPTHFDADYIEKNRGKYRVYLPEVHELVNIAVALTHIGRKDSNMVHMETDYYRKVMDHFDTYKDHALIDSLNQHITEVFGESSYTYYYNIRMNANMYSFEDDKILNKSPYKTMGFGGNNELEPLLPLLEDFVIRSDFKTFYNNNRPYYEQLINTYYELVPINKMWTWIEERFPQRYDSYAIYFSPLVGGAHSAQKFSDNGFNETVMFIDAPIFRNDYDKKTKEAILSRVVFTEIDHNYVNPTTDKYPEAATAMEPITCWNDGTQSYGSGYATFNEYMTWALFSAYLYDNFDRETFEARNAREVNFMANGRGFIRFEAFNDFMLEWYKNNPKTSLEAFYPEVIAWLKEQSCE